jgi:hypothetical protein
MMGIPRGSPSPPALGLRRAKPASAHAIIVAVLGVLAAGPAQAEVAAELQGEVRGPDGRPLPGVDLVVTDAGGRARQAVVADERGRFALVLPSPGVWRLALHGVGPAGARAAAVVLEVPPRTRVRIGLRVDDTEPAVVERRFEPAADVLPLPGGPRLPARGSSVAQAMTAVPGAAAPGSRSAIRWTAGRRGSCRCLCSLPRGRTSGRGTPATGRPGRRGWTCSRPGRSGGSACACSRAVRRSRPRPRCWVARVGRRRVPRRSPFAGGAEPFQGSA